MTPDRNLIKQVVEEYEAAFAPEAEPEIEAVAPIEKIELKRSFEVQVKGHNRRPSKKPRGISSVRHLKTSPLIPEKSQDIEFGVSALVDESPSAPTNTYGSLSKLAEQGMILESFAEDQYKAMGSGNQYHLMETEYVGRAPRAPRDIIEEDYSEESRP